MATYSKLPLSGSLGGEPITIVASSSPGTAIHTTATSSAVIDEVWLYATNTALTSITLTLEYGGTSNPGNISIVSIPAQSGLSLLIPGLILNGNDVNGRTIRAYGSSGNVVNVLGYVNRIS